MPMACRGTRASDRYFRLRSQVFVMFVFGDVIPALQYGELAAASKDTLETFLTKEYSYEEVTFTSGSNPV